MPVFPELTLTLDVEVADREEVEGDREAGLLRFGV